MKLVNKSGIPDPIFRAIEYSQEQNSHKSPKPDTYSVTELIAPPFQTYLKRRHWNTLEVDASDIVAAWIGTALHAAIEAACRGCTHYMCEKPVSLRLTNGSVVTGIIDLIDLKKDEIIDFKTIKSSGFRYEVERNFESAALQVACYRYLRDQNDNEINLTFPRSSTRIIFILKDWDYKSKYKNIESVGVDDKRDIPAWIDERISEIKAAERGEITDCTKEERWERNGIRYRCMSCPARKVCDSWKDSELEKNIPY